MRILHRAKGDGLGIILYGGGMMGRLWIGIGLLALSLNVHFSVAEAQEATGPRMVLKEKSVDLKEVDEGDVIEHVFKVLNEGDQPLEIKNVRPG